MDGTRRHEYQPILAAVDKGTGRLNAALAGPRLTPEQSLLPALIEHQVPLHIGGISEGVHSGDIPSGDQARHIPPSVIDRQDLAASHLDDLATLVCACWQC
ncbi:hypothetical protein E0J21_03020 [Rhizobium laguerreae]|nr:hypothetical protein E0J21_03020 [Rhizobium laguerreae]